MGQINHAVVGQKRIRLEIYLPCIVTQASGEVKNEFAIRDPQLWDNLTGPVLGLCTHLVPCNTRIRCISQGGDYK